MFSKIFKTPLKDLFKSLHLVVFQPVCRHGHTVMMQVSLQLWLKGNLSEFLEKLLFER